MHNCIILLKKITNFNILSFITYICMFVLVERIKHRVGGYDLENSLDGTLCRSLILFVICTVLYIIHIRNRSKISEKIIKMQNSDNEDDINQLTLLIKKEINFILIGVLLFLPYVIYFFVFYFFTVLLSR